MHHASRATSLLSLSGTHTSSYISRHKHRAYLYLSVCTGNLLALSVGLSFAWTSPMLPKLEKENFADNPIGRPITSGEYSWIGSFMAFGAMLGTFLAGYLAAKIGRKYSLLLGCAIPFLIGNVTLVLARNVYVFYVGRIVCGVAVGGVYTVVPMYLAEIAEDEIRGRICSSMLTFETFGELFTYSVGPYISIHWFGIVAIATTSIVAVIIIVLLPESPYYLLSMNNRRGAEKSLMRLRSSPPEVVKSELDFIQSVLELTAGPQGTICDLLKTKASRRAEFTTITLTILQHFSGIVPFLFYLQSIFNETGSSIPAEYCGMVFGIVQFLSSFVAPSLVDKLGRRWMLLISAAGMMVADFFLGFYFFLKLHGHDVSDLFWLPVACLVVYICAYVTGFGPLIWTVMGEIVPANLKAPAFTVGVCFWWTMAFTLSWIFHPISLAIGMVGVFWIFSADCLLAIFFILIYVIETKGKSFQEIQDMLSK